MPPKYYTLEEANGVLPTVKEMVEKIRKAESVREEKQREYSTIMTAIAHNGGNIPEEGAERLTKAVERSTRQVQRLLEELQKKFQCEVKGLHPILVDFYSIREGQTVYLCWKEGEDEIKHWHDLDAGFAGRRPIY